MKKVVFAIGICVIALSLKAQEGHPIVKPEVPDEYVMFKKQVQRRMNLGEKQNRPFFSKNGEISKLILEAVESGLLRPYQSDSTVNFMDDQQFQDNIQIENEGGGGGFGFGGGFGGSQQESSGPTYTPIPGDLFNVLYITEDVIFDRNRSRMYYYIRSITLVLPASAGPDWNPAGFEKPIASFRYQDLVDLFRGPFADRAIWFNNQNQAAHINFADAFELRLFSAPIIKISNADNLDISQQYGDKIAQNPLYRNMIQQKYEYDLVEFESELWEY